MRSCVLGMASVCLLCFSNAVLGEVSVQHEQSQDSTLFKFQSIPLPAIDDDAANAKWQVVRGRADNNSASLDVVKDGAIPSGDDQPSENFFFASGSAGGCLAVDLGQAVEISEIASYSWHSGTRAPQLYTLYAADESNSSFTWNRLAENIAPEAAGWKSIAKVDTRSVGKSGGQHSARVSDDGSSLGHYRYLLFEVQPTQTDDPFGHTFFSEIDVVSKKAANLKRIAPPEIRAIDFATADSKFQFTIDTTAAPELSQWSEQVLKPVIIQWYPKIVAMLPSEGFTAPAKVRFRYLQGEKMEGIPAYAQGSTISLNASWFNREKTREAPGAVVHEMVHVVQSYQNGRQRAQRRSSVPGWIVEGIPDYVRWYLYEPQSKGAVLSRERLAKAKHDASYRVSANFIHWAIKNHDANGTLLQDLNASARNGRYSEDTWKQLTGKSESELADAWRRQ